MVNDVDDLEEKLDTLQLESKVEDQRLALTRTQIVRNQLKKKYGKDWRKKLGMMYENPRSSATIEQFANTKFTGVGKGRPVDPWGPPIKLGERRNAPD